MEARYLVMEWSDRNYSKPLTYNAFRVNDISEFMNDELGIGRFVGDIVIIDLIENKIIDSKNCEWQSIDKF